MMANKKLLALGVLLTSLAMPLVALAYPKQVDLSVAINGILGVISFLFSAFAIIMFLFAGFLFLSANGEPSKVSQAQQALLWGTVGVIVGLLAFGAVEAISQVLVGGPAKT